MLGKLNFPSILSFFVLRLDNHSFNLKACAKHFGITTKAAETYLKMHVAGKTNTMLYFRTTRYNPSP
jgi:hypothetical protein